MKLSEEFALLSLNGVRIPDSKPLQILRDQCFVAAKVLESIENDAVSQGQDEYSLSGVNTTELIGILKDNSKQTIKQWIKRISNVPAKRLEPIRESVIADMTKENQLELIPALIACDLNYEMADVEIKQYRSSYDAFHREIEDIRREVFGGSPSYNTICLIWLLTQSEDLSVLFSKEENALVAEIIAQMAGQTLFFCDLYKTRLGSEISKGYKQFLSLKKQLMSSPEGIGIAYHFSALQKDESIFIATETLFPTAEQRCTEIKHILESQGHICNILNNGEVPQMEIDNIPYELIPDAQSIRVMNVHGVRLRKYVV